MKRNLALGVALLLLLSCMSACKKSVTTVVSEEGSYYDVVVPGSQTDETESDGKVKTNNGIKKTTNTGIKKTKKTAQKTTKPQKGRIEGTDEIAFSPIADSGANYGIKGTVKVAVDTVRPTDYAAMFDILQKLYPNIKIQYDYFQHASADNAAEYLSLRAKTGTLPDIVWDEAGPLPTYISQGWVRPITEFLEKDPEYANVPANLKVSYTFGKEVYAVPHQATFEIMAINTDILEELNETLPSLSWDAERYVSLLRKASSGYGKGICVGTDKLFSTATWYGGYAAHAAGKDLTIAGYNYETRTCEDISYYREGALKFREWRVMSNGVEGWYQQHAKNDLKSKLGVSDYTTLWQAGKALFNQTGTYETASFANMKANWVQWSVPNINGAMPFHVDHCFMTAQCSDENAAAAFQVLRFITYTTNGNLARLTMYDDANKDKYVLSSHIYYPTTTSKKVAEKYNSLSCVNTCDKYFLANIQNCYRIDPYKIVPEWKELQRISDGVLNQVTDGKDANGAGFAEARVKINSGLEKAWSSFNTTLKKVQADFNENHKR